nr:MATE family efflux transporter [Nitrincola tibetensis]
MSVSFFLSMWSLVLVSLVSTGALLMFAEPLTQHLGADERLLPHALAYFKGLVPFILPITLCFYSDVMLKALGHPKFSMMIMTSIVIINVALSLYFVLGTDMGTMGASLATWCGTFTQIYG